MSPFSLSRFLSLSLIHSLFPQSRTSSFLVPVPRLLSQPLVQLRFQGSYLLRFHTAIVPHYCCIPPWRNSLSGCSSSASVFLEVLSSFLLRCRRHIQRRLAYASKLFSDSTIVEHTAVSSNAAWICPSHPSVRRVFLASDSTWTHKFVVFVSRRHAFSLYDNNKWLEADNFSDYSVQVQMHEMMHWD